MPAQFQSMGSFNALHPTCQAMLKVPYPDPWEVSVGQQRRIFQRRLRDISGPIPAIRSIETVQADGQGVRAVPLTLYRPNLSGPLPLFLYIHGGGWVVGQHDQYPALCARIANQAGCIVASVGYGLSPETTFPGSLADCQTAYAWLRREQEWLGLDPRNIAIGGDSAGGNLSAALGLLATKGHIPAPKGLWLIYPVTDLYAETPSRDFFADGYGLSQDQMRWYVQQYISGGEEEAKQALASPLRMEASAIAAFPPSLIQTAGFDLLKDEARLLAERLDGAGKLLAYTCYEQMTHGFINAFDLLAESQMAVDEGTLWLRRLFD